MYCRFIKSAVLYLHNVCIYWFMKQFNCKISDFIYSRWDYSYRDRGLCAASERLPAEAPLWSHTAVYLTVPVPEPHCCGVQSALPLAPTDAWQLPHWWRRDSLPSVHFQHLSPHPLRSGEAGGGLLNPTRRTGNGTMGTVGYNLMTLTSVPKKKQRNTVLNWGAVTPLRLHLGYIFLMEFVNSYVCF